MADTHVAAEYQARRHIIFTARERSAINVRVESADGGPVGFNSYELLLIALANCTLGVVMNHESLANRTVTGCRATLDCTGARAPSRIDAITVQVEVDVEGGDEKLRQTLQRAADACPVGNTLKNPPQLTVNLVVHDTRAAVPAR